MSSRAEILQRIRRHLPMSEELPLLDDQWIRYDDPVAQFADVLASVGGSCEVVRDRTEAQSRLSAWGPYSSAKTIVSVVPGVGVSTLDLSAVDDPHQLEHVDIAILPGELAVAENGAVWVTDRQVPFRVLFFLSQHVVLIVPKSAMVHNLHEAYERISIDDRPFGSFISGPSKTADIEQALVIGAHGARSLVVYLVDEEPRDE